MDLAATSGYITGLPLLMNVRELGGIESADGRCIRHGLLYRGSALTGLGTEQSSIVDGFGLRCIFDLRAKTETDGQEDYVPEGAEYHRIAGMYDAAGSEMGFSPTAVANFLAMNNDPIEIMRALYISMAHGNPAVHALIDCLIAGKAPLYFHCSAGKDRTGVAAALILTLLGVPDDAIMEEFLLTNAYRAELIENPPSPLPDFIDSIGLWERANGVDEQDLLAVFASMDERCSTREEYFADEFGLDEAALAALRDRYLT
ncbi:MAG TPA: tyrosine-protein phosphatase [Atopobiaceae bacterium]|nr:tyrosine-protein phosphatase [Atopobiaceae bacterium]